MDKRFRLIGVATAAALAVMLTGGVASASTVRADAGHTTTAHHSRHHNVLPPWVFGTVASVNGSTTTGTCGAADTAGAFTLNALHNTTDTVDVSTTTTFSEHGVTSPTFANVCVGGHVGAVGTVSSDTVTATKVAVSPPPVPKPQAVFGTVASVNGSTTAGTCGAADTAGAFTLNALHNTTDTVDVSTTTTFSEHGVSAPTFANVCVGEHVGAVGSKSSDTLTATAVFVTPTMATPAVHPALQTPKGTIPSVSTPVSKPSGAPENNHGGFVPGSTFGSHHSGGRPFNGTHSGNNNNSHGHIH